MKEPIGIYEQTGQPGYRNYRKRLVDVKWSWQSAVNEKRRRQLRTRVPHILEVISYMPDNDHNIVEICEVSGEKNSDERMEIVVSVHLGYYEAQHRMADLEKKTGKSYILRNTRIVPPMELPNAGM